MTLIDIARPAPDVAILTLDRPERLNALSFALVEELHDALAAFERDNSVPRRDPHRRRSRLLRRSRPQGSGPHGADRRRPHRPAAGMRTQEYIASLVPAIPRLPQTVIAAINGPAFGGGLALAAACDIRIASTSARFGVQFVKIGISGCDIGISYTLPRIVGGGPRRRTDHHGREFDATEAERIGFVTRVAEDGELLDTATELAATLCNHSPFALAMTKQVLVANASAGSVDAAIALENRTQILAGTGGEFAEAVTAFAERRAPSWVH